MLPDRDRLSLLLNAPSNIEHGGPSLRRVVGCGATFLGHLSDPLFSPNYFTMHWFTALWIPIFPMGVYLVDPIGRATFRVRKRLPIRDFHRIYTGGLGSFYLGSFSESAAPAIAAIAMILLVGFLFSH
jgi:hypothetical protein